MDYILEIIAEIIGNINGKCEPEKMPDDLEFKETFVVKPYPKNIIFWSLGVIVCFAIVPFVYLGNGVVFACVLAVLGAILLILGAILNICKYEVDSEKIVSTRMFFFKKQISWDSISCVKLIEGTNDSSVALALYNEDKLVIDFVSPMKNFWNIQKLAEHLGYEIIIEKGPSLKKILHP